MTKEEKFEGFLHDIEEAIDILQDLSDDLYNEPKPRVYIDLLGFMFEKVVDLFRGEAVGDIVLTDEQTSKMVRAYTLVARATHIIGKEELTPKENFQRVASFGKILNEYWELLPFAKMVQNRVPEIARRPKK